MDRWSVSIFATVLGCAFFCVASVFAEQPEESEETPTPAHESKEARVTVEGSRSTRDTSEPELTSTVISGEALREPGVEAAEVLSRTPGVQVKRTGSSADVSTISLRGAPASQVPVYLAGVRLNDDIVGVADLSRIPLFLIHRVTVYRSAAPLTLGRSGMSGAVLFEPTLPKENEARASIMAGSFGAGAAHLSLTGAYDAGEVARGATTLAYRRAGASNNFSYRDDAGTGFDTGDDGRAVRENADSTEGDLWVVSRHAFRAKHGTASLTLFLNRFDREQGVTGLSLTPAEAARASLRRDLLGLTGTVPCQINGRPCSLQTTTGVSSTSLVTTDELGELALGAAKIEQLGARVTEQATFEVSLSPKWTSALSGIYETSHIGIDGPSPAAPVLVRAQENYFGGVATLEAMATADLTLRGAARVSCVLMDGLEAGAATTFVRSSYHQCLPEGRVGAHLHLSDLWAVRATALRGLRFVTLGERYGVSAATRGNSDLSPEQGWAGDIGALFSTPLGSQARLEVDSAAFVRLTDDLVAYQRSSLGYVRPYNVGSARMLGGEVTMEVDALQHLRARSGLSLLDARDTTSGSVTSGNLVPFQSPLTFSQDLEIYDETVRGALMRQGLVLYLNFRSYRVADPAGLIVIPGQVTLDAAYGVQLREAIELRFRAENILDSAQFDTVGFPLPGRAFFLSGEYVLR